jgi:hypothetical protein
VAITRSMCFEELASAQAPGRTSAVRILFRHKIENTGSAPIDRRLGLWCIVQVPSERAGTILIPLRDGAPADSVHPYFAELLTGVLRTSGRTVLLKALGGQKYKIGVSAPAATGGIAFVRPSRTGTDWILVSLAFAVDRSGVYLDRPSHGPEAESSGGDAVQAYNDPGTGDLAFSEIEVHAPAVRLEPGQQQSFEIEMRIAAAAQSALMGIVRGEIAADVTPSDPSW